MSAMVQHNHSAPADKAALLDFKTGFTGGVSVFEQWVPDSDPCYDNWKGVLCDCSFNGTYEDPKARASVQSHHAPTSTQSLMWTPDANAATDCPIPSATPYRVISLDLSAVVRAVAHSTRCITHASQASGRQALAGVLRPSIGNLTALVVFNIYNNGPQLGGPLPDTMRQLANLTTIFVSNNGFNGSLPAWAPQLKQLEFLYLANDSFTGPIPLVGRTHRW